MKVLVIDTSQNESEISYALKKMVGETNVMYASEREEIFNLLENETFDALVMELVLVGLDGFEVLDKVRRDSRHDHMKIFVASYVYDGVTIRDAFRYGINYYMIKPIDVNCLIKHMEETTINIPNHTLDKEIKESKNDVINTETRIVDIFRTLGVSTRTSGYTYLKRAVQLKLEEPEVYKYGITKGVYPKIAREFDTTGSRVERAIRVAIERTWNKGSLDAIRKMFGNTIDPEQARPTNYEFITAVCEYMNSN